MNDIRIILFLILIFLTYFKKNIENFKVDPIYSGDTIETNREVNEFIGPISSPSKKNNPDSYEDLYGIAESVEEKVDHVDRIITNYHKYYCEQPGKCLEISSPSPSNPNS